MMLYTKTTVELANYILKCNQDRKHIVIPSVIPDCVPDEYGRSIYIEQTLDELPPYLFIENTEIESVVIPDTVTKIGTFAFSGCINLKSITIPDSVELIECAAFAGCTNLEAVDISKKTILKESNDVWTVFVGPIQTEIDVAKAAAYYDTIAASDIDDINEITDADTILSSLIENADTHVPGLGRDLLDIWRNSTDRKAVEETFYNLTGVEFSEYVSLSVRKMKFRYNRISNFKGIETPYGTVHQVW